MNTDLMFSSATPEHFTPPWILDLVEKLGPIGLDPCPHQKSEATKRAKLYSGMSSIDADGLKFGWAQELGVGLCTSSLVFVNPPYGRELAKWAAKMARESQCAIIALVPARVDTGWWRELDAVAWCALSGRLKFWSQPHDWVVHTVSGEKLCITCGLHVEADDTEKYPTCVAAEPVEAENGAPFPSAVCLLHARHLVNRFADIFAPHGPVYERRR